MNKNYAIIENTKCVNVIVADEEYAEYYGYPLVDDGFWIGDYYYNNAWHHEPYISDSDKILLYLCN